MNFTKGPWRVHQEVPGGVMYIKSEDHDNDRFGEVAVLYGSKDVEQQANARLIACAPELLEALKASQWDCHGKCPVCAGWGCSEDGETRRSHNDTCIIGKVLAKATGVIV